MTFQTYAKRHDIEKDFKSFGMKYIGGFENLKSHDMTLLRDSFYMGALYQKTLNDKKFSTTKNKR